MEVLTWLLALALFMGTIISAFAYGGTEWNTIYVCLGVMSVCSVAFNIGHKKNKEE